MIELVWRRMGLAFHRRQVNVANITAEKFLRRWFGQKDKAPAVPPDCRVYAIGDIHGRSDLLKRLMSLIQNDARGPGKKILVFLGDYVDRGADSKGVIEELLNLPDDLGAHFLRGNHDQTLLDFLRDPAAYRVWREFGAVDTLLSYGVRPPLEDSDAAFRDARDRFESALPLDHRNFLESLSLSYEIGDYFFTHAGVRPEVPFEDQEPQDLLWIRDEFLNSAVDFGKVVVHGHTPAGAPVKRQNRIGIDTGAYFTGRLTAAVLEGEKCRFLQT